MTCTQNLFLSENIKNIEIFLMIFFSFFTAVKIPCILLEQVFVMGVREEAKYQKASGNI